MRRPPRHRDRKPNRQTQKRNACVHFHAETFLFDNHRVLT
jgi:hypothetical protein